MTDEEWRRRTDQRLQALETRGAVDDVHRANVETRLGSIEDTLKWLVRLVMGAIIMWAVAYAMKGGFSVG